MDLSPTFLSPEVGWRFSKDHLHTATLLCAIKSHPAFNEILIHFSRHESYLSGFTIATSPVDFYGQVQI